ncbi:Kelch-like protein 18 [Pseudocercospora fuligena]|uniref:Kelch-like protein 18 n=1 Tax=Pseudocercospora fuligena TaxID=685502 RepID=A0A8H6VD35_9PEZI|nr:Kelch-like protein 18 [Pseudocercospora fuligena]
MAPGYSFHDDEEKAAFCKRMAKIQLHEALCDVKIKCQSFEMAAHRNVLAAQSDWFLKAFTNGFVETGANEIILQEDEPSVIEALVHFCYNFDYCDTGEKCSSGLAGGGGPMAFNVHVFAAAEKYLIEPLQRFALNRLRYHSRINFNAEDFAKAIEHAYTATSDPKSLLRRMIIKISFDEMDHLFSTNGRHKSAVFDAVADRVPSYAADLMRAAQRTGRLGEECRQMLCPTEGCYSNVYYDVDSNGRVAGYCEECKKHHLGNAEQFGVVVYPE